MAGWEENELISAGNGKRYTTPDLLDYWIKERERIRARKETGAPKPWSDDTIFQRTYFTNVHREDDRVTRWIRANYTPALFGEFYEAAIVAARIFNRIETLESFKLLWFPVQQLQLSDMLRKWGNSHKTWGNAYVITTHGQKMSKVDYCVRLLQEAERILPYKDNFSEPVCQDWYDHIMKIDGMGSFLSAQVVADLKNTPGHLLHTAMDWYDFVAPGPGSLRGASWFFNKTITPATFREAIDEIARYLDWDYCMQDLQNCLCEFDKYCRVATATGRSKRNYAGI